MEEAHKWAHSMVLSRLLAGAPGFGRKRAPVPLEEVEAEEAEQARTGLSPAPRDGRAYLGATRLNAMLLPLADLLDHAPEPNVISQVRGTGASSWYTPSTHTERLWPFWESL